MNARDELPPTVPPAAPAPDTHQGIMARFRNYFLTGLVVAGPIAITFYLTWWFVTWVDGLVRPFVPIAYRPETYLPFGLPGSGLIVAVVALTLLGFLTANLIGRTLVDLGESLLGRIPAVRAIYRGLKQVFETLNPATEEVIAEGLEASKVWIRESIELQRQLVEKAGVHDPIPYVPQVDYGDDVWEKVSEVGADRVAHITTITTKAERNAATDEATDAIVAEVAQVFEGREREIKAAVRSLIKQSVRQRIAAEGVRMDGRGLTDIRPLSAEVGILPTAHGSALFERGDTQVLNVTTLGQALQDNIGAWIAPARGLRTTKAIPRCSCCFCPSKRSSMMGQYTEVGAGLSTPSS